MIPLCDNLGRRGLMPATWLLLGVWVALFVWDWSQWSEGARLLIEDHGLRPQRVEDGLLFLRRDGLSLARLERLLPLFTHAFLHVGPLQLLACLVFHQVFGGRVEARLGSLWQLVIAISSGLAGGAACLWLAPTTVAPFVGGSAVVTGQIVSASVLCRNLRVRLLIPVVALPVSTEIPMWAVVGAWGALQFPPVAGLLSLGDATPVPWVAHAGGAVAGVVLGPTLCLLRRKRRDVTNGVRLHF